MLVVRFCLVLCAAVPATATLADPVNELPLQRGYYVDANIPCAEADNSNLYLVTRTGINSAPAECTFIAIDQIGPTTFSVTDNCIELASGSELGEATTTYAIPDDHSYGFMDGENIVGLTRHCPQSELPEPYSTNDISDLLQ